jgi:tetratricopeptide (TPR) repeat protein
VDLSIVLEDIHRPPQQPERSEGNGAALAGGIDAVFAGIRTDVRRASMEEAERQYRRGLELREAGDVEGCIAALQSASQAPPLRFETASLAARLLRDRGMLGQAVDWFERAAEAPAPSVEEGHDLLYDLADVLEKEGETARALAIAMELQSNAGDYRDVAERIDRLTKVQARG